MQHVPHSLSFLLLLFIGISQGARMTGTGLHNEPEQSRVRPECRDHLLREIKNVLQPAAVRSWNRASKSSLTIVSCITQEVQEENTFAWGVKAKTMELLWQHTVKRFSETSAHRKVRGPFNVCSGMRWDAKGFLTKVDSYLSFVRSLAAEEVVLITDYDVLFNHGHPWNDAVDKLVSRFDASRVGRGIVAMAEEHCWLGYECTAEDKAFLTSHTAGSSCNPYLNSGGVMGFAGELTTMFQWMSDYAQQEELDLSSRGCKASDNPAHEYNDQRAMAMFHVAHPQRIALDHSGLIFGQWPQWNLSCSQRFASASSGVRCQQQEGTGSIKISKDCAVSVLESSSCATPDPSLWHAPGPRKQSLGQLHAHMFNCLARKAVPIPSRVLYVNMDTSVDRNVHMQNMLFGYTGELERVPAVTVHHIKGGSYSHDIEKQGVHPYLLQLDRQLQERTIACWLSHTLLLQRLSVELRPDETALILEDDAILPSDWLEHIESAERSAPSDWTVLKLCGFGTTREEDVAANGWFYAHGPIYSNGTFFYGGSCGYLVSGRDVAKILQHILAQPIKDFDASLLMEPLESRIREGQYRIYSQQKYSIVGGDGSLKSTIHFGESSSSSSSVPFVSSSTLTSTSISTSMSE